MGIHGFLLYEEEDNKANAKTEEKANGVGYYLLNVRHDYGQYERDHPVGLFTTIEKCVEWIKEHGLGWGDYRYGEEIDYKFSILSFVVDFEGEQQPYDEVYFCDKEGKTLIYVN